jgi:hypothetical protein
MEASSHKPTSWATLLVVGTSAIHCLTHPESAALIHGGPTPAVGYSRQNPPAASPLLRSSMAAAPAVRSVMGSPLQANRWGGLLSWQSAARQGCWPHSVVDMRLPRASAATALTAIACKRVSAVVSMTFAGACSLLCAPHKRTVAAAHLALAAAKGVPNARRVLTATTAHLWCPSSCQHPRMICRSSTVSDTSTQPSQQNSVMHAMLLPRRAHYPPGSLPTPLPR